MNVQNAVSAYFQKKYSEIAAVRLVSYEEQNTVFSLIAGINRGDPAALHTIGRLAEFGAVEITEHRSCRTQANDPWLLMVAKDGRKFGFFPRTEKHGPFVTVLNQ